MDCPPFSPSIRILPSQLADQIAAGEVIERPASVLKELMENALDAGATRIDVELRLGGMEVIRVTDNGHGISGQELPLAISRHATSKISCLDDLLQLQSLGFRGEALASICSVSQWEISSRRQAEDHAFSLRHDQPKQLLPVNHALGTSIWVRKLFYNTPARRKFLRAERTEFRHCDDVFRRMALARFDVGFYLKHNGRQLQRLPAVSDDVGRSRRVAQLCGQAFVKNSLLIDFPHADMRLWGWISQPGYSRQQTDQQYFYINGRIIRDRVINHAMRQAYQACLGPGRHAAYVLHLELDPASVDVNVHPTKHEVRFREARQIHDFLIRCLRQSLQRDAALTRPTMSDRIGEQAQDYAKPQLAGESQSVSSSDSLAGGQSWFGQVQAVLLDRFIVTQSPQALFLLDVSRIQALLSVWQWQQAYRQDQIKQRPMLIPQRLQLNLNQRQQYVRQQRLLTGLGFDLTQLGPGELLLRAVPSWLQGFDSQRLLLALLANEVDEQAVFGLIETQLLLQQYDLNGIDFRRWLQRVAAERDKLADCWRVLSEADLRHWLNQAPAHD